MATRKSQFSSADAEKQARLEQDNLLAGTTDAFGRTGELALEILALQQALLGGIAGAQRREAKRLAQAGGEEDPRIDAALERAARFDALHAEVEHGGAVAQHLAATFQTDGVFHGYVTRSDGAPAAEGHVVQLKLQRTDQRVPESYSAKTDAAGYFRMELAMPGRDADRVAPEPGGWFERFAQMAAAPGTPAGQAKGAAAATATTAAPTPAPDQGAVETNVQVLAPSGRVVFDDPVPPLFDAGVSEFRYYVLPEGRTASKGTR
jgi:hypothetical protein